MQSKIEELIETWDNGNKSDVFNYIKNLKSIETQLYVTALLQSKIGKGFITYLEAKIY